MKLANLLRAAAVTAALLLPAALWAQSDVAQAAKTQQQKDAQTPEAKKPHVWTDDDLPKASDTTISTAAVSQPAAAPAADNSASVAPAEGDQAASGQPAADKKPALDVKAAEDKLKDAQRDVDETKKVITLLQVRIINETGARRDADMELLQHSQDRLPGYESNLTQAQKDADDAHKAQQAQGQAGQPGQGAQPAAPPQPPQL